MKKILSLVLAVCVMLMSSVVYALPATYALRSADSFLEVLNRAHEVCDDAKLFEYVRFIDVNGDGVEEMLAICKSDKNNPAIACYLFSYTENGVEDYLINQEKYFDDWTVMRGGVDVFVDSGKFAVKTSTYNISGSTEFTAPHSVVYNELRVNENGQIVQGTYDSYIDEGGYEDDVGEVFIEESTPDEKQRVISRCETGAQINVYTYGELNAVGCPAVNVGSDFISRQDAMDYLKQKRDSVVSDSYSGFNDVLEVYSADDMVQIQNLLKKFGVSERKIYALLSEDELISLADDILSFNYPYEMISPVNTYDVNSGGCMAVYDTDEVEDFIYALTGCRIDCRKHVCPDENCMVNNQDVVTWNEVDSITLDKINSRDLMIVNTGEGENNTQAVVKQIYELAGDKLLVMYEYNDDYESIYTYAVVGKRVYGGKNEFFMIEQGGQTLANSDYFMKYSTISREPSNITIDYDRIKDYTDVEQCVEYISDLVSTASLNDSAKEELAQYIGYIITNSCTAVIDIKKGIADINSSNVFSEIERAETLLGEIYKTLSQNAVVLNKSVGLDLKFDTNGADLKKGVTIAFDKSLIELASRFGSVEIICDENKQSVCVDSENLVAMLQNGCSMLKITSKSGKYMIQFLDEFKNELSKCVANVTFSFEADHEFCSVYYVQNGENVLLGGIVDATNNLIRFMTMHSGVYLVEKNVPDISDIDNLTDEEKEAIQFMVSRGYMTLSDDCFNPYGSLTRYEFTKILVGIFYAQAYDAVCTFPDVEDGNPYYTYVASSEESDIVKGYEDGTFKGYKNASNEEIISVAARTLADKKNYIYPENTDDYIQFVDTDNITDWDEQHGEIALAVREGLIDKGGILAPKANITRVAAAVILYRLFKLLYGEAPAVLSTNTVSKSGLGVIPMAVASGVVLVAVSGAAVFLNRKKKLIRAIKDEIN